MVRHNLRVLFVFLLVLPLAALGIDADTVTVTVTDQEQQQHRRRRRLRRKRAITGLVIPASTIAAARGLVEVGAAAADDEEEEHSVYDTVRHLSMVVDDSPTMSMSMSMSMSMGMSVSSDNDEDLLLSGLEPLFAMSMPMSMPGATFTPATEEPVVPEPPPAATEVPDVPETVSTPAPTGSPVADYSSESPVAAAPPPSGTTDDEAVSVDTRNEGSDPGGEGDESGGGTRGLSAWAVFATAALAVAGGAAVV